MISAPRLHPVPIKSHPLMGLSLEECERRTLLPDKTTAIICTSSAPLQCFMWAVLSLLIRSDPFGFLEHITVVINGPDPRTGSPRLQDRKQAFLEELRALPWRKTDDDRCRDMPLTICRVWSQIGHSQAIEAAVPWCHTQNYLLMHDDAILLTPDWQRAASQLLQDPLLVLAAARQGDETQPAVFGALSWQPRGERRGECSLALPHLNTVFTLCRKALLAELGARWIGYHVEMPPFRPGELLDREFARRHYRTRGVMGHDPPDERIFTLLSMDIGSWVYREAVDAGYRFGEFPLGTVHHFVRMSWGADASEAFNAAATSRAVRDLELEISRHEPLERLYRKYADSGTVSTPMP